jgi:hypothetical protein
MTCGSSVWLAVMDLRSVVFGTSVFNLTWRELMSSSFENIWVIWLAVRVSNPHNAVCNPSILAIVKSPSLIKSCLSSNASSKSGTLTTLIALTFIEFKVISLEVVIIFCF